MATNDRYVSLQADIKAKRSRFHINRRTILSYFHGYLQPIGSPIEILPGDTIRAKISAFTRMSTPIVPFVDNIRQEIDAFFVPKRIIWNGTKQFYGEAPSFGIATKIYEPTSDMWIKISSSHSNAQKSECISYAFGLTYQLNTPKNIFRVNLLPVRAFLSVYNEYFRNENYQTPYTWDKDANGIISDPFAFFGTTPINGFSFLPVVNKDKDVITSLLPYAQKGSPVTFNLLTSAPVMAGSTIHDMGSAIKFGYRVDASTTVDNYRGFLWNYDGTLNFANPDSTISGNFAYATGGNVNRSNLYADLSNATASSINDLIYALAYQDFLMRCAHYGTRYKEYIYAMFGCEVPDLTADVPEYLGRLKFNINVQQVVQTTGFVNNQTTELGMLGAYSNSGNSGYMFTKSFTEPGYLIFVTYTKHQRTYSDGVDRVFVKRDLLDYYQTPFADIPDLPFDQMNIYTGDTNPSIGFQEPWWEYHTMQDRCYGLMNPNIDTLGEIWTLANKYSTAPTINGSFMHENRDNIKRVLSTGDNGPDYIMDFVLDLDATRVMPLYSSGILGKL